MNASGGVLRGSSLMNIDIIIIIPPPSSAGRGSQRATREEHKYPTFIIDVRIDG